MTDKGFPPLTVAVEDERGGRRFEPGGFSRVVASAATHELELMWGGGEGGGGGGEGGVV